MVIHGLLFIQFFTLPQLLVQINCSIYQLFIRQQLNLSHMINVKTQQNLSSLTFNHSKIDFLLFLSFTKISTVSFYEVAIQYLKVIKFQQKLHLNMRRTIHLMTIHLVLLLYLAPIFTVASPTKEPVNPFSPRETTLIKQFNLDYYNNHILDEVERADTEIKMILSDFQKCFRYYEEKIAKYQARMDRARKNKDTRIYDQSRLKAEEAKRRQNNCFEQRDSQIKKRRREMAIIQASRQKPRVQRQKAERMRQEKEAKERLALRKQAENERQRFITQINAIRSKMERQESEKERDLEIIRRQIEKHLNEQSQTMRRAEAQLEALRSEGARLKAQHDRAVERENQRKRAQTERKKQQKQEAERKLATMREQYRALKNERKAYKRQVTELQQLQHRYQQLLRIKDQQARQRQIAGIQPSDQLKALRHRLAEDEAKTNALLLTKIQKDKQNRQNQRASSELKRTQADLHKALGDEQALEVKLAQAQTQLRQLEASRPLQDHELEALTQQSNQNQGTLASWRQAMNELEANVNSLRQQIAQLDAQISNEQG